MEPQHGDIAAFEHVGAELDFDSPIVAGAGQEPPRHDRARLEFQQGSPDSSGGDKSIGVDPDPDAFDEDVPVDRQRGVEVGAEDAVVF